MRAGLRRLMGIYIKYVHAYMVSCECGMLLDRTLKFLLKQFRGNSFVFVRTMIASYAVHDGVMISANAISSVV